MNVREATDADVAAIKRVAERSWEQDYPDILSRETVAEGVHEWYDEVRIERELHSDDANLFVAESDGELTGFVHTVVDGPDGDVLRLYVDPDHRDAGIGTALLDGAVEYLFGEGVDRVKAMVLADNVPGNQFYDDYGFEPTGTSNRTEIAGEFYGERTWLLEETV